MFHLYQQVRAKRHPRVREDLQGLEGLIISTNGPMANIDANGIVGFPYVVNFPSFRGLLGSPIVHCNGPADLEPLVPPMTPSDVEREEEDLKVKVKA